MLNCATFSFCISCVWSCDFSSSACWYGAYSRLWEPALDIYTSRWHPQPWPQRGKTSSAEHTALLHKWFVWSALSQPITFFNSFFFSTLVLSSVSSVLLRITSFLWHQNSCLCIRFSSIIFNILINTHKAHVWCLEHGNLKPQFLFSFFLTLFYYYY